MGVYRLFAGVIIAAVFILVGCAPRFSTAGGAAYKEPQGFFRCILPSDGWAFSSRTDITLALWNKTHASGIAVNVTPLHDDHRLDLLVRHLLIAFDSRTVLARREIMVGGRRAQGVVLDGWVEDENIVAEAYVIKGDGVVYDIVGWSPPDTFAQMERVFHEFVQSIRFLDAGAVR